MTQDLFCAFFMKFPQSTAAFIGPFCTHDIKSIHHFIVTGHLNSDRGTPEKLNSIPPVQFSITYSMPHVLERKRGQGSLLDFPGLPCSFSGTHFISSAVSAVCPATPTACLEGVLELLEDNQPCNNTCSPLTSCPGPLVILSTYEII